MKILFESNTFSIVSSLNKKNTPHIDGVFFYSIKNSALGKNYNLSLVLVGSKKAKKLNQTYRKKDYTPDILSFDLDKENGEIYIHPAKVKSKAKEFNTTPQNFLNYLFVHGLAHLKGMDHHTEKDNAEMQNFEKNICKKFKIETSSIHN